MSCHEISSRLISFQMIFHAVQSEILIQVCLTGTEVQKSPEIQPSHDLKGEYCVNALLAAGFNLEQLYPIYFRQPAENDTTLKLFE